MKTENLIFKKGLGSNDSVILIRDKNNRNKDELVVFTWARCSLVSCYPCDGSGKPIPTPFKGGLIPKVPTQSDGKVNNFLGSIREAAHYVYQNFLKNPYKNIDLPKKYEYHGVYRPNHGLCHTLRVSYYSAYVNKYASFNLPDDVVKSIQIALLFYVCGREGEEDFHKNKERHRMYRQASSDRYHHYIEVMKSKGHNPPKEAEILRKILNHPHDYVQSKDEFARKVSLTMVSSHDLDMMRCRSHEEYKSNSLERIKSLFIEGGPAVIPDDQIQKLKYLAKSCIVACGDKIYKCKRDPSVFVKLSKSVDDCVDVLLSI